MTQELPARIWIQIREGKLNLLAEHSLRAIESIPQEDGTIDHKVSLADVVAALAVAMRDSVRRVRDQGKFDETWESWLEELLEGVKHG